MIPANPKADIRSPVFRDGYGPNKRHRVMKRKDRPVTVSQKFNLVFCQAAKVAAFFRFPRQLSGPNAPRPVAKRGSVAGRGEICSRCLSQRHTNRRGSMPIVSNWSNAFVAVATKSYSRDTQLLQSPPERAGGAHLKIRAIGGYTKTIQHQYVLRYHNKRYGVLRSYRQAANRLRNRRICRLMATKP